MHTIVSTQGRGSWQSRQTEPFLLGTDLQIQDLSIQLTATILHKLHRMITMVSIRLRVTGMCVTIKLKHRLASSFLQLSRWFLVKEKQSASVLFRWQVKEVCQSSLVNGAFFRAPSLPRLHPASQAGIPVALSYLSNHGFLRSSLPGEDKVLNWIGVHSG